METDILILQLRQSGVEVPAEVGQVAFIDTDHLYAILRQALPLCGLATEAEIKKQFPAKLPTSSPSARFYVLNSFDTMLKKKATASGARVEEDDDDEDAASCPSTTESLMYPSEATTRALLSWAISTIAARQEKIAKRSANANGKSGGLGDDDEEGLSVAPSLGKLLGGSLLQLRTKMMDNAGVISGGTGKNKNAAGLATMNLLAIPAAHPFEKQYSYAYRRRNYADASSSASTSVVPAMIPVAPVLTNETAVAAGLPLADLNRIAKQTNLLYNAPRLVPQRAKVFALSQALTALQIHNTSASGKNKKKGGAPSLYPTAAVYEIDEASVRKKGNASAAGGLLQYQHANGALGSLFFDTDAAGLDITGAAHRNKRAAQQQRLDEVNKELDEVEEKTKSAAQRLEEREAELQRIQDALSEAKKQNKGLRQALAGAEGEFGEAEEALQAFVRSLEQKEESLQTRRETLEKLQTQLSWMENYEETVETFKAQIAEARSLQKQVQEDLQQKMAKMETKKEELSNQVAVAGDGRQEEILAARNKVKKIKREIRAKTREIEELKREYERVPKDIDRSLFLRFIFDMTNNIQRQQAEVDKVKIDLHKEAVLISEKTEKLQQLFSTVEQEVYKRAIGNEKGSSSAASPISKTSKGSSDKNSSKTPAPTPSSPDDEFAKEAFKRIVAIREAYANLRLAIQNRGDVRHEVHIMEEKNSKAMRLGAAQDIKKVTTDLTAVEEENDELSEKLEKYLQSRGGGDGSEEEGETDATANNAE